MAVLAMPGMGYDTYRLWEALALGSMPVLERGVGLDRTLYRLPALLVDDFVALTEDLVRQAYVEALYRADDVSLLLYFTCTILLIKAAVGVRKDHAYVVRKTAIRGI